MQFLRVRARTYGTNEFYNSVPVLIDGQVNGVTNTIMLVERGVINVSVDVSGAETKTIDVDNTTYQLPKEVLIEVLANHTPTDIFILSKDSLQPLPKVGPPKPKQSWLARLFSKKAK